MRDHALSEASESSFETQRMEGKTISNSSSSNESHQGQTCEHFSIDDSCQSHIFSEADQTHERSCFDSRGFNAHICSCNTLNEEMFRKQVHCQPATAYRQVRTPRRISQNTIAEERYYESLLPQQQWRRTSNRPISEDETVQRYDTVSRKACPQRIRRHTESELLDRGQNQNICSSGLHTSYTTPFIHTDTLVSNPALCQCRQQVRRSCPTVQVPTHDNVSPACAPPSQYDEQTAARIRLNGDTQLATSQAFPDDKTYIHQGKCVCSCFDNFPSNRCVYILFAVNIIMIITVAVGFPYMFFAMEIRELATSPTALPVFHTAPPCRQCNKYEFTLLYKNHTSTGLQCCTNTSDAIMQIAKLAVKESDTLGRYFIHASAKKMDDDGRLLLNDSGPAKGIILNRIDYKLEVQTDGVYFIYSRVTLRLEMGERQPGSLTVVYSTHRNRDNLILHGDTLTCLISSNPTEHSLFTQGIARLENKDMIYATVDVPKDMDVTMTSHSIGMLFISAT